jgi:hypothetical protein
MVKRKQRNTENPSDVVSATPIPCKGESATLQSRRDGSTRVICPNLRYGNKCEIGAQYTERIISGAGSGMYNWLDNSEWYYPPCKHAR